MKDLLDTTNECLNNLKNNNINIENWDPLIIHIISNKLDSESQKTWEEELQTIPVEELPTLEKFKKYLEGRFRVTEMIQTSYMKERTQIKPKSFATITSNAVKRNTEYRSRNTECGKCKENHDIFSCKEFIKLDPVMRTEYIKKERLCFNCLRPGHSVKFCRYRMRCDICNRKHHTLIHITKPNLETINNETEEIRTPDNQTMSQHNILSHVSIRGRVSLLATALVNLETSRGPQIVRAFIDPCSEESFISEAVVKRLQLKCKDVEGQVSAVGQMSTPFKHAAEIELSSRMNKNYKLKCTAYVIKHVTDIMPATRINYEHWTHFSGIELADPTYHTPGNVDLLLGVHVYTDILMSGVLKRKQGEPIAQQTYLGWIISGGEAVERLPNKGQIISMHLSVTLDNMLQRFWECESLESENKNTLTSQEARAEEIYEKTVMRDEQGRYVVSLPFVRDNPILPENSREIAMRRLRGLERRLAGNENLKREYDNVLKEYITLNHMELVKDEREKDTVYLPHHAVFRDDKTTSKVRVVFDASCRGTNGVSLNDGLLIGPNLQEELRDIILRWRTHKIVFVADIIKMYRQIKIQERDTKYQRILYRFNQNNEIQTYKLLTVTFGMASAPYLAIKTMRQLAKDENTQYPVASKIVNSDFYMDDVLTGFDNVSDAINAQKELAEMLLKGKFELQKISSNSQEFMNSIDPEKRVNSIVLDIIHKETVKTLGIMWETNEDSLKIAPTYMKSENTNLLTKRNILRQIASLFDPMGWLSPAIIKAKIFMQKLWLNQVDWDEELSNDLKEEWNKYKNDLPVLSEIKIPRWNGSTIDVEVELHGFADASQSAYAAVVYTRVLSNNKNPCQTTLIMARTKVAPVKQISLPRLELCAAALLSKLLKHVMRILSIDTSKTFAWSDSKVTLAWIKGDPNKWTPFVKNRVIEIRNNLNIQWLYINTKRTPLIQHHEDYYPVY
ncbi:uncharacterized protein LOC131854209 [Achroia grisella]|uniref:uncharacterized protein LOC131854209 n=1 Tax=Achroia grisella TaxID=688607 RepID=UPI0027D2CF24|nr:uncharacterized protein LOC131854209 [Achroia grisella]